MTTHTEPTMVESVPRNEQGLSLDAVLVATAALLNARVAGMIANNKYMEANGFIGTHLGDQFNDVPEAKKLREIIGEF